MKPKGNKRGGRLFGTSTRSIGTIKDQYNVVVEDVAVDEEDLSISGQYEKVLAENAKKLMASREKLNTALEQGSYREAKAEEKP